MQFLEVLILGIGLSMDALAVSLSKGLTMRKYNWKYGAVIAAFFGGFQAIMPILGWLLATSFAKYITAVDHWIAFGLLFLIGGKMILDAIREKRKAQKEKPNREESFRFSFGELLLLAVATSIDALAVGISFAFLEAGTAANTGAFLSIWTAALLIGVITFLISFAGVWIGHRFGSRFETGAQIAGGIILILIGIKILLEHLL